MTLCLLNSCGSCQDAMMLVELHAVKLRLVEACQGTGMNCYSNQLRHV